MTASIGDRVEVAWVDHTLHVGSYSPKAGLTTRLSVGYLVRQDDEVIVIAQTYDTPSDFEDCIWFIAGCVLAVTKLRSKP